MSKKYKIVFLVRFFGYLLFFSGVFATIFIFSPLLQVELGYRLDKLKGVKRTVTDLKQYPQLRSSDQQKLDSQEGFATFSLHERGFEEIEASETVITPVSTQYGIVIEKINANAKIIPGVNAGDEREYTQSLKLGVAEALGSTPPGEPGNLYLFSHSTNAPWNIIRYNAIFYLLGELESGDRIVIFYQNRRYDYIVFDKIVTDAKDVSYLTNTYATAVLTLQTCDPPGTLLKRLVVRAKLVNS